MSKNKLFKGLDEPLMHPCHPRPKTRREFLAQGFTGGVGAVMGSSMFAGLMSRPAIAEQLSDTIIEDFCQISAGNRKIPFICFDLAGGANTAGSNVLVGGPGGQLDLLSDRGYARQGLPRDMIPGAPEPAASETGTSNGLHMDNTLGLYFHSDSAFLRGILDTASLECCANVNGCVLPSRSENDTGNNPHNPLRAINMAGSKGDILYAVASRANEMGGGNSRLPNKFMLPQFDTFRETKVDRGSDTLGLVKVGDFGELTASQVVATMEAAWGVSKAKLERTVPGLANATLDAELRRQLECTYVESAYLAREYPSPDVLNIIQDANIQDIFSTGNITGVDLSIDSDREFEKTASVMKLVIGGAASATSGYAGVGNISMGGYDYHGNGRGTGEVRDRRAGRCMGACLEYAHRLGVPLMLAVYSDGSLSANGTIEGGEGRGKFMWQSDNQNTRCQFFLVYDPTGRPQLRGENEAEQAVHQQIGYMNDDGNVNTNSSPMANSAENTVDWLALNYMALHGEEGNFASLYASNGISQSLGTSAAQLDRYIAFQQLGAVGPDGLVATPRPSA